VLAGGGALWALTWTMPTHRVAVSPFLRGVISTNRRGWTDVVWAESVT